MNEIKTCPHCERHKSTPRGEEQIKKLKNRINRVIGQLGGINKMIDDNRYCGDILIQLSACQSALDQVSSMILKNHIETCVVDDIKANKNESIEELISLLEKTR